MTARDIKKDTISAAGWSTYSPHSCHNAGRIKSSGMNTIPCRDIEISSERIYIPTFCIYMLDTAKNDRNGNDIH